MLKHRIRDEISARGPLTFARFMEFALYDADDGYYSGRVERAGSEWVTAPTLTPAFGRTLARGILPMLRGVDGPPALVEFGVGGGHLVGDVVLGLHALDAALVERLRVVAVESNPAWLDRVKARFEAAGILDVECRTEGPSDVRGVVLSNELVDALPFHVAEWTGDAWTERLVAWDAAMDRCVWTDGPVRNRGVLQALADARAPPSPGLVAEARVAAAEFVTGAGHHLRQGAMLTIDYGGAGRELWRDHPRGTFHAYHEGLRHDDVLANPGRQDITALVDFTALVHAGRRAGLAPAAYATQGELLLGLGIDEVAAADDALAVKKLVHPDGAGGTFKALLQTRGVETPAGWPGAGRVPG